MRRRDFVRLLGAAAAAPLGVRAQQAIPVIGFLSNASAELYVLRLRAFRQGLREAGYVEGQNVTIEYRWAEEQNNRLPVLASELVNRRVDVIAAAGGTPSVLAAKAATSTIPIVFAISGDPIKIGLVSSLNRPGGNMTGITNLNIEVGPKRLELLRELLPTATVFALLVNPTSPAITEPYLRAMKAAAAPLGLQLPVLQASTGRTLIKFLQPWSNFEQMRSWSPLMYYSIPGASSLQRYRFAMRCRQSTRIVPLSRPVA